MEPILGSSEFRVKDLDKEFGYAPPVLSRAAAEAPVAAQGGGARARASSADGSAATAAAGVTGPGAAPASEPPRSTGSNLGWLLRLFKSDFFDAWMAVTYLYKYRGNPGVQDYLCNELYSLSDVDLETYLPQICNLLLYHAKDCTGLERFVLDKCAESVHLALQVYWFMEAAVADAIAAGKRDVEAHCRLLRARCESAAINGGQHSIMMFARRKARDCAGSETMVMDAEISPAANRRQQTDLNATDTLNPTSNPPTVDQVDLPRSSSDSRAVSLLRSSSLHSAAVLANQPDASTPASSNPLSVAEAGAIDPAVDSAASTLENDAGEDQDDEFGEFLSAELPKSLADEGLGEKSAHKEEPQTSSVDPRTESPADLDDIAHADPSILVTVKQERFGYFDDTLMLVKKWVKFSFEIRELPLEHRPAILTGKLTALNEVLFRRMAGPDHVGEVVPEVLAANGEFSFLRSVHLPLVRASDRVLRVLRINPDETVILNTKTKAPYMLFIEVVETKMFCNNRGIFAEHFFAEDYIQQRKELVERESRARELYGEIKPDNETKEVPLSPGAQLIAKMQNTHRSADPQSRLQQNVKSVIYGDPEHVSFGERLIGFEAIHEEHSEEAQALSEATIAAVFGELWKDRQDRILKASPFGVIPETKLMAFIVKAGDDLRQEQLAVQLIAQFKRIFDEEKVDVYLRAYTIMCSNAESGLIECLSDATSLHSLKKKTPNFLSIRDYFERAFGPVNSIRFQQAQKAFIESMAGYSLVSYFLQILDRHNGNIMLEASGRVIHIDFGFMLGNSPGAVRFESAPFKLTEEYIEVMATRNDQGFNYFKELMVLGFLAARKHHEKICTLVEVMIEGTSMPCMAGGQQVIDELRARFLLGLPESECIQRVLGLIDESYANWRSKQYDRFQYMTNGIL